MSKENKPRLSVLLNADSVGTLAKYKANGQTATETVRRSLALYDFLMREVEVGNSIAVCDKKGNPLREVKIL